MYEPSQFRAGARAPAVGKLDEARETADPVRLMRLFGITSYTAIRYVRTAHPERFTIDPTQA